MTPKTAGQRAAMRALHALAKTLHDVWDALPRDDVWTLTAGFWCDECSAAPTLHCGACGCLDHAAPGGQCPLCSSTEPTVAAQVTIADLPHAAALRWARDRKVTT